MADSESIVNERLRQAAAIGNGFGEPDGFAWSQSYRQDVTALRARLTTAETERDGWRKEAQLLKMTPRAFRHQLGLADRLRAAEARVEAVSEALRQIEAVPSKYGLRDTAALEAVRIARAALACPPQQPQKAGE